MPITHRSNAPLLLWLGYVSFVIYGSLVPLDYRPHSFDEAWAIFQTVPYLNLGAASRADWIANGVLYVPVGFFTCHWLSHAFQRLPTVILLALAAVFSVELAVGVEFMQVSFPPRTVSLNDIYAECIGGFLGMWLFTRHANWFQSLLQSLLHDTHQLKLLILQAYGVAYLAFALFPYDVVISWAELDAKLDADNWGWWIAGDHPSITWLFLKCAADILQTLPFGIWLAYHKPQRKTTYARAFVFGLLLGLGLEMAKLFLITGTSQGMSVLTKMLGVAFGLAIYRSQSKFSIDRLSTILKRLVLPLTAMYLLVLLKVNGLMDASWHGLDAARASWDQTRFIPFYYHYFTTEGKALFSLVNVSFSYLPVAILGWGYRRSAGFAALASMLLAFGIETCKLFSSGTHPDPTNILIAGVATGVMGRLLWLLTNETTRVSETDTPSTIPPWLVIHLALAALWTATFPVFQIAVALILVGCAIVVWHRPVWAFAIIFAALPVFDLAPWSGRFFLDEFDALLLVIFTVAYARTPATRRIRLHADPLFYMLLALVALSFAISTVRGLMPFQWPDANSLNNYHSPYNALRIAKGAMWALLSHRLLNRFPASGIDAKRMVALGMTIGLGFTVAFILWERVAFSGLWNFSSTYRVTGPFSEIHVGGAYIECFVSVATPFLIQLMLEKRNWLIRCASFFLLMATTYTLMVTFSRNGFSSFAVGVFIVLLSAWINTKRKLRSGVIYIGIVCAMLLVALPIYHGEFVQSRMATVRNDFAVRQTHWHDALNIRNNDLVTSMLGMGLGRYPEISYWRSTDNPRSGTYRLEEKDNNTFLRLGTGDSIYLEQIVNIEAGKNYKLQFDVRPSRPDSQITIPICEKLMLTSYNCIWQSFNLGKEFGTWRSMERIFTAKELSVRTWYSQRPIKLAIYYSGIKSTIDIDNIQLKNEIGINIIRNGDFSTNLDHWFFVTDSHLQWHIKSLFYGIFFDQGWFGLITFCIMALLALFRAGKSIAFGVINNAAPMAALSSFLVVGIFDTLIDSPRFLMLLILLTTMCAMQVSRQK